MTPTHVLVPVEPTEAMLSAGIESDPWNDRDLAARIVRDVWACMLAAAPRAPEQIAENANCPSAREKALEEALRPFAELADTVDAGAKWLDHAGFTLLHHHYFAGSISLSSLRAARALFDAKEG